MTDDGVVILPSRGNAFQRSSRPHTRRRRRSDRFLSGATLILLAPVAYLIISFAGAPTSNGDVQYDGDHILSRRLLQSVTTSDSR